MTPSLEVSTHHSWASQIPDLSQVSSILIAAQGTLIRAGLLTKKISQETGLPGEPILPMVSSETGVTPSPTPNPVSAIEEVELLGGEATCPTRVISKQKVGTQMSLIIESSLIKWRANIVIEEPVPLLL